MTETEKITTIMAVNRTALKNFKKKAVALDLSMIELHKVLADLPINKLKELVK
jgi:hypothetical protein